MSAVETQLLAVSPTVRIDHQPDHQPEWYLALDTEGRALVDQILATLDARAPGLADDERTRVFWNTLKRLGVWEG
jgi:hypothetical protein